MKVKLLLSGDVFEAKRFKGMKVNLLLSGDVFEAKRFKDMSPAEIASATKYPHAWDPDDVFAFIDGCPLYVHASEVEILEEVK